VGVVLIASPAAAGGISPKTARALLEQLQVASPSIVTKYERRLFPHWRDSDRNCRNTRAEVLVRESSIATTGECDIVRGRWTSLYDGATVLSASELEIDHVVALKEAWISGAWRWSRDRRVAFANDLDYRGSLLAVTESSHEPKRDKDPAHWLPSRGVCEFAVHWVAVKWRWQLTIDLQEQTSLKKLLSGDCGKRVVSGVTRYLDGS